MNMEDKEKIMEALECCIDFCCDECPYHYLDDKTYTMRCIHTLIKDTFELLKKEL